MIETSYAEMMEKYKIATEPSFNQEAWDAMKGDITLGYLLQRNTEGPFKNTNLLAILANGNSGPFLEIFEKFKDEISYKEFLYQPSKESPNILTQLASARGKEDSIEPFLKVFSHYRTEIDLADLVERASNSPSVLWHLAWRASLHTEKDKAFLAVWQEFHMAIPLATLIEKQGDGELSIIWYLGLAYYYDITKSFLAVWKKFEKEIPLAALTAKPVDVEPCYEGISVLWHITQVADESKQVGLLLSIWERFKKEMSVEDWLAYSDDWPEPLSDNEPPSPYCGKTALGILATSNIPSSKTLATIILKQLPGLIPYTHCYDIALLSQGTGKLLHARNEFYFALEAMKMHRTFETEKAAQDKAKKAKRAGYSNAHFELANYFASQNDADKKAGALKEISSESWHYEKVQEDIVLHTLDSTKDMKEDYKKRLRFDSALQSALRALQEKRVALLQKVAACYILGVNSDTEKKLIPENLVVIMTRSSLCECWRIIEEIRRTVRFEAEKTELKRQFLEPSQLVDANLLMAVATPVLQFNLATAAPVLEQLNPDMEDKTRKNSLKKH